MDDKCLWKKHWKTFCESCQINRNLNSQFGLFCTEKNIRGYISGFGTLQFIMQKHFSSREFLKLKLLILKFQKAFQSKKHFWWQFRTLQTTLCFTISQKEPLKIVICIGMYKLQAGLWPVVNVIINWNSDDPNFNVMLGVDYYCTLNSCWLSSSLAEM